MNEVYEEYKKYESKATIDKLSAWPLLPELNLKVWALQVEHFSVTEYPREMAWNADDGGRVDYISDYEIVE